jgi:hypothetical protein
VIEWARSQSGNQLPEHDLGELVRECVSEGLTPPIRAVTHLAKVQEIKPYKDTGKYQLIFEGAAQEITPVRLKDGEAPPQGPFYVKKDKLLAATTIDEMLA